MDLNLVVLCGTLVAEPHLRRITSGRTRLELSLAVRAEAPQRRVDIVTVIMWDPPPTLADGSLRAGVRVWVAGSVKRRPGKGPSEAGLEIVAEQVSRREEESEVLAPPGRVPA